VEKIHNRLSCCDFSELKFFKDFDNNNFKAWQTSETTKTDILKSFFKSA